MGWEASGIEQARRRGGRGGKRITSFPFLRKRKGCADSSAARSLPWSNRLLFRVCGHCCGHRLTSGVAQVKSAVQQLKKLLQEATLESDDNKRPLFSKYTV